VYLRENTDKWTILKSSEGPLKGDCEDYVLTVLWIIAGSEKEMSNMIKNGDAELWLTHTAPGPEHTHMMLWVKGKGWIDCNHRKWSKEPYYDKEKKITWLSYVLKKWLKK